MKNIPEKLQLFSYVKLTSFYDIANRIQLLG